MITNEEKDKLIDGLKYDRVTKEQIDNKIKSVDFVEHRCKNGSILRWCAIEMENGFTVTGKPSASVSPKNDNKDIGEKIAYDNAYNNIWQLEGYLLFEKKKEK